MTTLLHSPPSPYSAKARMAVRYSGYPATLTLTDTGAKGVSKSTVSACWH